MAEQMKKATGLDNTAPSLEKLRESLYSIKVKKNDAIELEKKLNGEVFKNWFESCEVNETTKIPVENIDDFLDDMQTFSKGITDEKKSKMRSILTDTSNQNIVEWDFTRPDNSGAQYGIVTFGKYPDGMYVDCLHVVFKMDVEIASQEKKPSKWCKYNPLRLLSTATKEVPKANPLEQISSDDFQNFCRHKVLEKCYKDGYIDRINYVISTEGSTTSPVVSSELALENGTHSPQGSPNKKKKMKNNN